MKARFSGLLRRKRLIAIILVIVAVGFFIFRSRGNGETFEESEVMRGTVEETLVLTGEIKATDYASLQFNSSGTISWVGVKVGDTVEKGQALIKLDTTVLNSAFQVAQANLRAAEANLAQVHDEVKGNDSDESFEEKNTRTAAETAKDKAYEAFVAAQKDLRNATLVAPFDGVVAVLNTESSGVNITAGAPQVVVVNPSTIYFLVNADQTEVNDFKAGDTATLALDAFEDEEFEGVITSVSAAPNPAESGTVYPIRLSLNSTGFAQKLKVGMTGDATFVLSSKEDVLYVPSKFVKSDKDGKYLLVNAGKDKKYVQVGLEGEDSIEVTDISEGEKIYY